MGFVDRGNVGRHVGSVGSHQHCAVGFVDRGNVGRHVVSVGSHQHCAVGFVRFSYFNFYGFCFVIELMWIFLFTVLNHVLVWMHDDLNEFFHLGFSHTNRDYCVCVSL